MLRRCLDDLAPRHRDLLRLRYEQGLRSREIGGRLERTVTWVTTALQRVRAMWQAAGAVVNVVAVVGALALARGPLALRPVDAWGSICGGLTSSAALHAVRRASESSEPAISYVAAYAVASVLATLAGPLLVLWMS